MAQSQSGARILSSTLTVIGLGLVWIAVATNWPSQDDFVGGDSSPAIVTAVGRPTATPTPSPELDLTIPTSPPLPRDVPSSVAPDPGHPSLGQTGGLDGQRVAMPVPETSVAAPLSGTGQQVTQLKCEAEIERLCPDGMGRMQCLQRKAQHIPPMCQQHVRERFVKWKEDRARFVAACEADTKRFCSTVTPGGGQILQCLQEHAQDLSDQCYQTLPKGKLLFRQ